MPRSSSDLESHHGSVLRRVSFRNSNAMRKSKSSATIKLEALADETGTYNPAVDCCSQRCGLLILLQQSGASVSRFDRAKLKFTGNDFLSDSLPI